MGEMGSGVLLRIKPNRRRFNPSLFYARTVDRSNLRELLSFQLFFCVASGWAGDWKH